MLAIPCSTGEIRGHEKLSLLQKSNDLSKTCFSKRKTVACRSPFPHHATSTCVGVFADPNFKGTKR